MDDTEEDARNAETNLNRLMNDWDEQESTTVEVKVLEVLSETSESNIACDNRKNLQIH